MNKLIYKDKTLYSKEDLLNNIDLFIEVLKELKQEQEKAKELSFKNTVQKQQIAEYEAKQTYQDRILQDGENKKVTEIAKDYGMTAQEMNKLLQKLNIQYKQYDIWFIRERYANNGYTVTKNNVFCKKDGTLGRSINTRWTQKGRLFLYDVLKENGVLPLIERC